MTSPVYVEDIFLKFFDLACLDKIELLPYDWNICSSLKQQLTDQKQITANQGNFILKLLGKHAAISAEQGLDYEDQLQVPVWKNEFRVLDLEKRVFLEKTDSGINICFKFPYSLKNLFDKEIDTDTTFGSSTWDNERKLRVCNFYNYNIIRVHEFCKKHGFHMDENFLDVVSQVEEIWDQHEEIDFRSKIEDNDVVLINAPEDTRNQWQEIKTGDVFKDSFSAKSMGYPVKYDHVPNTVFEKICSASEKLFWLKTYEDFFSVHQAAGGISVILLDRNTKDIVEYLKKLVSTADNFVDRSDIKICFREEKSENSNLNNWIKSSGLGGKVDQGKILIFLHKPAKWLFAKSIDVKIIGTNSYTPHMEPISASWIQSHPCILYVDDVKPTSPRNKKIVNL
jgi:hypothetical protein